ncbi:hypothetical protein DK254_00120 [Pseudomonas sp. RW407]|uniref:hypothetical protein n=1 Tax=Pseudomonas sp. RW407 TaxID=2202894 RepID=UPI000D6EC438|nr:hypothetical protein [Pseudomonas sp. RW407]PWU30696.1 hypothetical protein DK254_11540 [Pseudomonas sp. RW407]PWU32129.1 hypothetical protein DK254_00120 [Pseudomonas sp. RW407]
MNAAMTADEQSMFELGAKYQQAGLMLTPYDCQPVDQFIFAETRGLDRTERARIYNRLRGAFNRGWHTSNAAA